MRIGTSVKESRMEIASKEMPVIPMRAQVIFPGASVAFEIGRASCRERVSHPV